MLKLTYNETKELLEKGWVVTSLQESNKKYVVLKESQSIIAIGFVPGTDVDEIPCLDMDAVMDAQPRDIIELDLSVRSYRLLFRNNIHFINELERVIEKNQLSKIKGIGPKGRKEIQEKYEEFRRNSR